MQSQTAFCQSFIHHVGRIVAIGIALIAFVLITCISTAQASIFRWDWIDPSNHSLGKYQTSTLTPGGAGVSAVPSANLSSLDLTQAYLINANLTKANLVSTNLTNADLSGANLTNASVDFGNLSGANLTAATVVQADFSYVGLSSAQVYSTASYQARDLHGIRIGGSSTQPANLTGWDFSSQNLTSADFTHGSLAGASFTGATISQAIFSDSNLTASQLYSTTNYQAHDLHGMYISTTNMAGWNFAAQNLTSVDMRWSTLTGANFSGANVQAARFLGTNLTPEQLYSTASYQAKNLQDVMLPQDVSGWNLSGQNLTHASFTNGKLANADFSGAIIANGEFSYSNLTANQLYSTASYQTKDLHGLFLRDRDLSGWDLSHQNLSSGLFQGSTFHHASFVGANLTSTGLYDGDLMGADFTGATLTGADFSRSDLRGATVGSMTSATTTRTIMPDGSVTALEFQNIRNSDHDAPIHVLNGLNLHSNSWLYFILDNQPWHSTISNVLGTHALLGGELDLTFDSSLPSASYAGRTYKLFDWSQVGPSGTFGTINVYGLPSSYMVDTSHLYLTGEITIVPEPSTFVLFVLSMVGVLSRVQRLRRSTHAMNYSEPDELAA